ncbi:MAG TPA: ThuA domain-containing protein [Verrucomicrobiae bacterium]|nr:ThuA domain-containing protein [Verrucomicrobiae bacterium]
MKPAIHRLGTLVLALLALLLPPAGLASQVRAGSSPLRVLILTGAGTHDWKITAPLLRQLLDDTGRFETRICETPAGISAPTLAPFDVVVDDYLGPRLGKDAEKAIEEFVKSGKGLIVLHSALMAFNDSKDRVWPGFFKMTKVTWPTSPANEIELPFRVFPIQITREDHPITRGAKTNWHTGDRPLGDFTLKAGAEVLATTARGEPLVFASTHGKGRVVGIALGHDQAARQEKAFITLFDRGTEWAASGQVTLPAEIGLPEPNTNAVRVLIITGGHDHFASFYALFSGYKDLGRAPVSESRMAFQEDLRPKYDVIVMYDFSRDLEDKGKKNLRDFVEAGKGVVVLHHGILNYQKWPWWYEEVVGGRYRLSRENGIPNSTVKMGEEHLITPVQGHPITAGIGPFHVIDETYHGLFIAPGIQPLLTTDNPTSDRVVGWVGPCTTSRVVFLQLGHDHSPFRHPSYRALVHNSILWTAGRLN